MTDTTTLAPTDAEILALNRLVEHFSETPSKYPEAGHGTQYHAGAPGVLSFARAVLAKWGAPAPASDQWRRLFGDVAELVKCLPSSYPDANGHVFKKLRALVEQAPSDGADMPEHWSVVVNIGGKDDPLLTIGHNWLSGAREPTEADTQAIIGAAQHLLAFVGYGLPPTSFDPDEAAPPAQEARLNPDMPVQELRLHMGELTSDEVLVARSAIRWANSQKEARVPLSDEQIDRGIAELGLNYLADAHVTNRAVLRKLCRHVYGITAAQKEAP